MSQFLQELEQTLPVDDGDNFLHEEAQLLRRALIVLAREKLEEYFYNYVSPYLFYDGGDQMAVDDYIEENLIEKVNDDSMWDEVFTIVRDQEEIGSVAELLAAYLHALYTEMKIKHDGVIPESGQVTLNQEAERVNQIFSKLRTEILAAYQIRLVEVGRSIDRVPRR